MPTLDPELAAILKRYNLKPEKACWHHKQSGKWIVSHNALERIASTEGIWFDDPAVFIGHTFESGRTAVSLYVKGHMPSPDGPSKSAWSIGEASPANSKNQYDGAMAEKRAKDRVILKLIGLYDEHSEIEADDFKKPQNDDAPKPDESTGKKTGEGDYWGGPLGKSEFKEKLRAFDGDLYSCDDMGMFLALMNAPETQALLDQCERDAPSWWFTRDGSDVIGMKDRIEKHRNELQQKEAV